MVSPSDAQDKKNTSWLSKIFGKDRHTDKTNTRELADEPTTQDPPALKIEALLESVNSASQQVRNFYITFLVVGFYIAMIIWSTTDVMLLKETPVRLPIFDVELPITGFYWFAPFFYLLLHFNLLLQLGLLSDKINRFDDAVATLEEDSTREYYYSRLFSFAFTQAISGRRHFWFLKFLLTLMVWITIIWLPLGLLIGLQVGFLAYHGEDILFWQRFAIGLDLVFLAIFWPIIRSRDGDGLAWIRQIVSNIVPSLVTCFSPIRTWVSLWLPIPRVTKQSNVYLALKKYSQVKSSGKLFFESNIIIITWVSVVVFSWGVAVLPDSQQEISMAKIVPEKWLTEGSLRDADNKDHRYFRLTEYLFDKTYQQKTDGTILTQDSIFNRNLRIREKLLIANELAAEEVADITSEIDEVRKAALKKVEELVLSGRDFRYADFSEARLPKVDFFGANKDPSDLSYANLQSTMLSKARMNGATLQGTNLSKARLQGANLIDANLQGADLIDAYLQGANLTRANLQGALLEYSNLTLSDISDAKLKPMSNQELAKAKGEHVWSNKPYGDVVHTTLYGSENQLNGAVNESNYQNNLSAYLIELSCQDQWVATGIIKNRTVYRPFGSRLYNSFVINLSQCLLSLIDQKNQSDQLVCPALSEIGEDTVTRLKGIAAIKYSGMTTEPTLECKTELSDPPSDNTNS